MRNLHSIQHLLRSNFIHSTVALLYWCILCSSFKQAFGGFSKLFNKMDQNELKKQVGYTSVDNYIQSGMVVGLGTGSTAYFAVERLGQKLASGELRDIVAIPTSMATQQQAESLGIPLTTLSSHPELDVAIDGADEVDPDFNLVKGRGGALLREKMVEINAKRFVCIVDSSKFVSGLGGSKGAMPVEVVQFCWEASLEKLKTLPSLQGASAKLREGKDGQPYVTDNSNYIIDLYFEAPISDCQQAAKEISEVVGVVEHGLFLGMADIVISAGNEGVETLTKKPSQNELKKQVGYAAVDNYVRSGMVVGLGTGSTAYFAVERVGQKLASGELTDVVAIPTSIATRDQAASLNIPLVSLDTHPVLDVAIDGADEVDPNFNLVKGRGGALLREKMVEANAKKFVCIVDDSKFVDGLGTNGAMPVEVTQFCWLATLEKIKALPSLQVNGAMAKRRESEDGTPYVTDNGNFIIDLYFEDPIPDVQAAAEELLHVVGVVEHGLFLGMADTVISASNEGVDIKAKTDQPPPVPK